MVSAQDPSFAKLGRHPARAESLDPATLLKRGPRDAYILLVLREFSSDGNLLLPGVRRQIDHKLITAWCDQSATRSPRGQLNPCSVSRAVVGALGQRIGNRCPRTTSAVHALIKTSAAARIVVEFRFARNILRTPPVSLTSTPHCGIWRTKSRKQTRISWPRLSRQVGTASV